MGKGVIKIVLIAGAAYLVYKYAESAGWLGVATPALPGVVTPPANQIAATHPVDPSVIVQALRAAATANGMSADNNFGGYEWGWIWQRSSLYNGSPIGPAELGISDTEKVPIARAVSAIQAILPPVAGLGNLAAFASAWAS